VVPIGVALVLEDSSQAPRLALRYPPPLEAKSLESAAELFYHLSPDVIVIAAASNAHMPALSNRVCAHDQTQTYHFD
jgi:hypothetical protein